MHQGFMPQREIINNVLGQAKRQSRAKREQKMTDFLAFSEFWRRLSHLGKFNTCQWHSACTKFGHSSTSEATLSITNHFITLSQALTYNSTSFIYCPRGRVNLRLFLERTKGGCIGLLVSTSNNK